ncbi:MAG: transglutaminase-like domain-containing protein, partial [Defluviitaleaceae bacterium]|nr:transglutaminase-like domain-containing protein [Defluviitaleaceae bacterium]
MRPDEANIKNKRRGAWDYAFAFLIGPLYVYSVCLSVLSSTLIKYTPAGLMTASALAFLIFVAVLAKKKTFFAALALLAVFAAYEWATGKWPDRAEIIGDLSRIVRGFSAYGGQYDRLITLFICSGVALFAVIFLHKKFNFLILIAIGSASFVINQIMDYSRDESALVIFVFCFVALLIRRLNGSVVPALISLPFCAAAVAVSLQIPMYKPIDRGAGFAAAFRRPVDAVGDFIYAAFNPKYFSFQNTGFTSSSNLIGGPVSVNSRAVMQVEAPARTYLSGATKNVYDGKSWTDTLDGAEFVIKGRAPGEFEYLETAAALSVASSPNAWTVTESDDMSITRIVGEISSQTTFNYVILNNDDKAVSVNVHIPAKEELRVHIGENRTGTVFVPPKFSSVSFNGGSYRGELFYGASGDMRVSGLLARGAMYRFDYFRDNPRSLLSRRAMDESRRGFYRIAREQVKDVPEPLTVKDFGDALTYSYSLDGRGETGIGLASVYDALGITADELVAYSDFVYKNYTSLPESLPERVRSLARELTKDCQTNIERIRAIENYFVSIPYTLSPPPVPEGVDFVDHFLFEAPKGYCVYYASAMAVLLRCLEIPTRYKEGFLLPTAMTDGFYIVTNRHAHAWAEAYLEGY